MLQQYIFNSVTLNQRHTSLSVDELHSQYCVSYFRLLQRDKNNLEALRMLALHSLCRDGDLTEVNLTLFLYSNIFKSMNFRSSVIVLFLCLSQ